RGSTTLAWTRDLRPRSPTPRSPSPPGRGGTSVALDLGLVEGAEARLEGLLVEELTGRLLARFPAAEVVERFLRADQVVLGVVVGHLHHAADGPLGGAQRVGVLLLELVGDLLHPRLEPVGRDALGDEALLGGLLAGQVLAHHRVV